MEYGFWEDFSFFQKNLTYKKISINTFLPLAKLSIYASVMSRLCVKSSLKIWGIFRLGVSYFSLSDAEQDFFFLGFFQDRPLDLNTTIQWFHVGSVISLEHFKKFFCLVLQLLKPVKLKLLFTFP